MSEVKISPDSGPELSPQKRKQSFLGSLKELMPGMNIEMAELHDFMHDSDEEGEEVEYDENGMLVMNEEAVRKHKELHGRMRKKKRGKFGGGNVNADDKFHKNLANTWDKDGDGLIDIDEIEDYLKANLTWTAKVFMSVVAVVFCCTGSFLGTVIIGDENMGGRAIVPVLSIVGALLGALFSHLILANFFAKSSGIRQEHAKLNLADGTVLDLNDMKKKDSLVFEDFKHEPETKDNKTLNEEKNGDSAGDMPEGFV